ncbi:MAG: hypothetical protein N4J56_004638 [Chroococcidiopsis sp. SAG 2025]|nr:hypothetical protein [Chroococcidiopsis sp. SAG 2025]
MKLLPISKGAFTDDELYEALIGYGWRWHVNSKGYVAEDAACAFNKAALEYHGKYTQLNKVLCNFDGVSA